MNRFAAHCLRGFSAIDLLIVFSITCICVVTGTPFLSNYAVRSKITEAIAVADSARTAITVVCAEAPNLGILDNRAAGFTFTPTRYVSDLELEGSCATAIIRLQTADTGARPDPVVTLTGVQRPGENRMDWTCSGSGPELHLPSHCRP